MVLRHGGQGDQKTITGTGVLDWRQDLMAEAGGLPGTDPRVAACCRVFPG